MPDASDVTMKADNAIATDPTSVAAAAASVARTLEIEQRGLGAVHQALAGGLAEAFARAADVIERAV